MVWKNFNIFCGRTDITRRKCFSKSGGESPWGGESHHGMRKSDQSTESNRTG